MFQMIARSPNNIIKEYSKHRTSNISNFTRKGHNGTNLTLQSDMAGDYEETSQGKRLRITTTVVVAALKCLASLATSYPVQVSKGG